MTPSLRNAALLLVAVASSACASLPQHVKEHPLHGAFDPAGYDLEETPFLRRMAK